MADGGAGGLSQPQQQLDGQPEQPGGCGGARALGVPLQVQFCLACVQEPVQIKKLHYSFKLIDYLYVLIPILPYYNMTEKTCSMS